MAKIRWGGKVTDSHSTATETAGKVIQAASELVEVSKISLGIIKHVGGGGQKRLKFTPINGGLRAQVRGNGAVQELYVYTSDPATTKKTLSKGFA